MPPIARQPMPVSPQKALERLETLCMRAERCTGEMREKMRQWGLSAAEADKIIKRLTYTRFVDDRRFAAAYVRDKIKLARWGRIKVRHALYLKRVDKSVIADAIESIGDDEYYNLLYELLAAKTKGHPELLADIKGRTRLYRFAAGRGFESALISRAVKSLMSVTDTDIS